MKTQNFCFFIGTTAEFIKLAPIIRELKTKRVKFKIITSGQNLIHFQELKAFTGPLVADIALPLKISKSSVLGFFIWTIKTFIQTWGILSKERNTYLIVHGDTISSLLGTIVGKICGLKVIQIESGLRSFNMLEPLPEEISRMIITRLADIFFAPNSWALNNLSKFKGEKFSTGENTLIESCLWAINKNSNSELIKSLKNYYVLFIHRQEHIYFNKDWAWDTIQTIMNNAPKNLNCILVMHALTSRILTPKKLDLLSQSNKNLVILPKLPYVDFVNLMYHAQFIATDSCTSQEEAHYLGVPYLGLRNLTERTEGLGENVVITKGDSKVITNFLTHYKKYKRHPVTTNKQPAKFVVKYLLSL